MSSTGDLAWWTRCKWGGGGSDLSRWWWGVSDTLCNFSQDADEPALAVKLFTEASACAAEQRGQQVLIAYAELGVLQSVLQQPVQYNSVLWSGLQSALDGTALYTLCSYNNLQFRFYTVRMNKIVMAMLGFLLFLWTVVFLQNNVQCTSLIIIKKKKTATRTWCTRFNLFSSCLKSTQGQNYTKTGLKKYTYIHPLRLLTEWFQNLFHLPKALPS